MTIGGPRMEAGEGITPQDRRAALAVVRRFAEEGIAPASARFEQPMAPEALEAIVAEARELGILPAEEGTPGLWSGAGEADLRLSVAMLVRLGEAAAGPAFEFHQRALAARLARASGLGYVEGEVPLLFGRGGLGREAFAGFFGPALSEADLQVQRDVLPGPPFGDGRAFLLQAGPGLTSVIAPTLSPEGEVGWARWPRSALALEVLEGGHGLDETRLIRVAFPGAGRPAPLSPASARTLLLESAALNALGAVAVALGAATHARRLAGEQARLRRQGGRPIAEHAAVRRLLGQTAAAVSTVSAALAGIVLPPRTPDEVMDVLSLRAVAHPLLGEATNAALQVFGGSGYMRETGLEKLVRDTGHLRLLFGTPEDLLLLAGRWETLR